MYFANGNPSTMSDYNIISSCHFSFNNLSGIHYYAGSSCIFENNIILDSGSYGILVESSIERGVSHNNTFTNNLIQNVGAIGIYIYGLSGEYGKQNKAVGNTILGSKGDGIQFEYQNYFVIGNNDIDMTTCDSDQEGIRLLTRAQNGSVTGNTIYNSDGNGICATSWALNLVIANNQISQAGTAGIAYYGTVFNSTIIGNRVQDSGTYDIYLHSDADGNFIACNHVESIFIDHTTTTCDYNRFFGNVVSDLSQSGSGTGNNFTDNYPDNTP